MYYVPKSIHEIKIQKSGICHQIFRNLFSSCFLKAGIVTKFACLKAIKFFKKIPRSFPTGKRRAESESDIIDRYFYYYTEGRIKECSEAFCCFSQLIGLFEDSIEEGSNAFVLVSIKNLIQDVFSGIFSSSALSICCRILPERTSE